MGNFLARLQGHQPNDAATPLPASKVAMCSLIIAANDLALVSVYPTLPFQVKFFLPELSDEALGTRAGLLGASFNVGQLFGSLLFGRLSDRFGRRPIMLFGLLGTVISLSLFAFAVSFEMAVASRLMWGFLNANIGIAKTYLSEVTDDSNQARAFGWLGVSGGLVRLVGPALGGLLALPAKRWPAFDVQFFRDFPFVLSCALGFVLAVCALVATFFFLEESLPPPPDAPDAPDAPEEASEHDDVPGAFKSSVSSRALRTFGKLARARSGVRMRKASGWTVMKRREPIIAVLLYSLIGLATEVMVEIWPLLLLLPRARGGYELDSSGVGLMLLAAAPLQMVVQTILYPRLVRKIGNLKVFRISVAVIAVVSFVLPFISPATSVSLTFGRVAAGFGWVCLSSTWMCSFVSSFLITNNSCAASERGTVNGCGHALVALARIIGPLGAGFVFAWSVEDPTRPWPIDYHFMFHIAALIYVAAALTSLPLRPSIDKAYKADDTAAQIALVDVGVPASDEHEHEEQQKS